MPSEIDSDYFKRVKAWFSTDADWFAEGDLGQQIIAKLESTGKDVNALTPDDLGEMDAWHIRGRPATLELAEWANIRPEESVLDVGCGLGGGSRHLAITTGCTVTGLDLIDDHIRVATMLTERMGLSDRVSFRQGNVLDMPFEDGRFDVVWIESCQICFPEKQQYYNEIRRVLRPGGRLVCHEIVAGSKGDLHFPVPWASEDAYSHPQPLDELREMMARTGFRQERWEDRTDASVASFNELLAGVREYGWPPVSLALVMGSESTTKFDNLRRNLAEDRLRTIQAIMIRE